MATRKPGVQQRRLASKLLRLRINAEMTVEQAAEKLDWSRSKLSRIENAATSVSVTDTRALCELYETGRDLREHLAEMARQAKKRGWWHAYSTDALMDYFSDYVEMESEATSVVNFEVDLIPGLLQTDDYARAIMSRALPDHSTDAIESKVQIRIARQKRVEEGLSIWTIVDEGALRRGCGDTKVMLRQLEHLRSVTQRPNVTLQVLPFSAGPHFASGGPFFLLDFGGKYDPVAYVDTLTSGLYVEEPKDVERYRLAVDHLRALALDPHHSHNMIEDLHKQLVH
jgi:transcriptional regulator with XRE-family HTH domain